MTHLLSGLRWAAALGLVEICALLSGAPTCAQMDEAAMQAAPPQSYAAHAMHEPQALPSDIPAERLLERDRMAWNGPEGMSTLAALATAVRGHRADKPRVMAGGRGFLPPAGAAASFADDSNMRRSAPQRVAAAGEPRFVAPSRATQAQSRAPIDPAPVRRPPLATPPAQTPLAAAEPAEQENLPRSEFAIRQVVNLERTAGGGHAASSNPLRMTLNAPAELDVLIIREANPLRSGEAP